MGFPPFLTFVMCVSVANQRFVPRSACEAMLAVFDHHEVAIIAARGIKETSSRYSSVHCRANSSAGRLTTYEVTLRHPLAPVP
jgi:hypothetical protein